MRVVLHEAPAADAGDNKGQHRNYQERNRKLQYWLIALEERIRSSQKEENRKNRIEYGEKLDEHFLCALR